MQFISSASHVKALYATCSHIYICAQLTPSQAQPSVTKSASTPALDFFGNQKGTTKRKLSEVEEAKNSSGKKIKNGAQGRGGRAAGVYGRGLKCTCVDVCDVK